MYVIKTNGLEMGKSVVVTESIEEALDDIRAKLSGKSFGKAGRSITVEVLPNQEEEDHL